MPLRLPAKVGRLTLIDRGRHIAMNSFNKVRKCGRQNDGSTVHRPRGARVQMKLSPLICAFWLIASCPSWAGDQEKRFLEFPNGRDTTTFDLNTVQIVQPGKFTIIGITIDDPDVMKLKLKVLATLRTYCARANGEYPAPADVFTLGPPDMPVANIEVKSDQLNRADKTYQTKHAFWSLPYVRLALNTRGGLEQYPNSFHCKNIFQTEEQEYSQSRASIMNGIQSKSLFDCMRGLHGGLRLDDDPSKAVTGFVRNGTKALKFYLSLCQAVTHETPYVPSE
jgi:hypothetical protein